MSSATRLYIGSLAFKASERDLEDAFGEFGTIEDVRVITDRDTGRSRGFGFVTFSSADAAKEALDALDGHEVCGREVKVSFARERGGDGGGGWGGGGRGGGYGGGGRSRERRDDYGRDDYRRDRDDFGGGGGGGGREGYHRDYQDDRSYRDERRSGGGGYYQRGGGGGRERY